MSFQALTAVDTLDTPNAYVTLLLYVLGQWAGPDGSCFPGVETIAEKMRCSVSQARKALKEAEEAGFIRREDRTRRDGGRSSNRIILTYCERPDLVDDLNTPGGHKPGKGRRRAAPNVSHPPLHYGGGSRSNTEGAPPQYGGAFLNQSLNQLVANAPNERASAIAKQIWEAWPEAGRAHSSERLVADAVAAEAAGGADLNDVLSGGLAYAAKPSAHGSSGAMPKSPHLFLTEGRWKTHARKGWTAAKTRTRFANDAIRTAAIKLKGEAWVASWLDPCGFDEGKGVIDPRLKDRIPRLREVAEVLTKFNVKVGECG
ncbi:MAG: putative transcriptional regulator, GntR family [Caulobacter sp.]|nr:putative transcriptional regulator, GntR family [Caulobacter sp.]